MKRLLLKIQVDVDVLRDSSKTNEVLNKIFWETIFVLVIIGFISFVVGFFTSIAEREGNKKNIFISVGAYSMTIATALLLIRVLLEKIK